MQPVRVKPNLFLIGAMKSGTTYLTRLLASHPLVFMSQTEEPSYFADPQVLRRMWPEMWRRGYWKSENCYLRLFRDTGGATLLGEASTIYTKLPRVRGVAEKIRAFNPEARIIYLIRDPVERTISHYWHAVRSDGERRAMQVAIKEDPHYRDVSYYSMQLRPYLNAFGRSNIHVLTFEELTRAPVETMHELFNWLGIGWPGIDTEDYTRPENVTPDVVKMAKVGHRLWDIKQSSLVRDIVGRMPLSVRAAAARLTSREVRRRDIDATEVIKILQQPQSRQTEELEQLVGRRFPDWTTLYGHAGRRMGQSGSRSPHISVYG